MDVTTKTKLLQQRRDYKKARAADNSNRSCLTHAQKQNVKPRCADTNDVEFDAALFEPVVHDSDDEGCFYKSVYQCNFSFVGILVSASC
jgi:hypothetical protein